MVHQPVDRVAIDLLLEPASVPESVTFDPDAGRRERRVRESLGDVPVVLAQPRRRVATGFIEQRPEFVSIFGMQSARCRELVEPMPIHVRQPGHRVVTPPGHVAV